jgi:C4-dicarboxylate-specific signal transduction histidine kinase
MYKSSEQELLKKVLIIPLVIIAVLATVLIYLSIQTQKLNMLNNTNTIKSLYIEEKKNYLKSKIDFFITHNKYDVDHRLTTIKALVKKFNSQNFISKEYIFVYDEVNLYSKDKFAKMLINPNRLDLVGKYVSLNVKDINGFEYRRDMLKQIQKSGEAFVQYAYKKPDNGEIANKISYFKYLPELKMIVASGVYLDNIDKEIALRVNRMKERQNYHMTVVISYILITASIIGLFLYFYVQKIRKIFFDKNRYIEEKNIELQKMNLSLEKEVQKAVLEIEKRDEIILQNSKISTMSEIINMIAHQWRQPLNVLSLTLMNLSIKFDTHSEVSKELQKAEGTIHKLSTIIDDFRKLFTTDNQKREYDISDIVQSTLDILSEEFKFNKIEIKSEIEKNIHLQINKNDLVQSLLNILQNSKDALLLNKIENSWVEVKLYIEENSINISIKDNGGGITNDLIDKIFEPYFSTKQKNERGLGMYRTKILIEKNSGEISIKNGEFGLITELKFFIKKGLIK